MQNPPSENKPSVGGGHQSSSRAVDHHCPTDEVHYPSLNPTATQKWLVLTESPSTHQEKVATRGDLDKLSAQVRELTNLVHELRLDIKCNSHVSIDAKNEHSTSSPPVNAPVQVDVDDSGKDQGKLAIYEAYKKAYELATSNKEFAEYARQVSHFYMNGVHNRKWCDKNLVEGEKVDYMTDEQAVGLYLVLSYHCREEQEKGKKAEDRTTAPQTGVSVSGDDETCREEGDSDKVDK